jgi:hypothetical protein
MRRAAAMTLSGDEDQLTGLHRGLRDLEESERGRRECDSVRRGESRDRLEQLPNSTVVSSLYYKPTG